MERSRREEAEEKYTLCLQCLERGQLVEAASAFRLSLYISLLLLVVSGCATVNTNLEYFGEYSVEERADCRDPDGRCISGAALRIWEKEGFIPSHIDLEPRFEWCDASGTGQFSWVITYYGTESVALSPVAISLNGGITDPRCTPASGDELGAFDNFSACTLYVAEDFCKRVGTATEMRVLIGRSGENKVIPLHQSVLDRLDKFYQTVVAKRLAWIAERDTLRTVKRVEDLRRSNTRYVNASAVNTRIAPSKNAAISKRLNCYDTVILADSLVGDWLAIRGDSAEILWIRKDYLSDSYVSAIEINKARESERVASLPRSKQVLPSAPDGDADDLLIDGQLISPGHQTSYIGYGTPADDVVYTRGRCDYVEPLGSDENGLIVAWHYPDVTYVMKWSSRGGVGCYRVAEKRSP
jgi:hypothetical protein